MKANPRTIFDIFDGKRRYIVPLFQRQYVWSRIGQWEPLWEDIRRKINDRIERKDQPPHFLGALVLDQIRVYGNEIPSHLIIDGQQRLTTFQIFLAAFRDICKQHGSVYSEEIHRYILNTGVMAKESEECFKVWPTHLDQPYFKDLMKANSYQKINGIYPLQYFRKKPLSRPHMVETYSFFYKCISDYLEEIPEIEIEQKIEILFQVLKLDLEVVTIELEGKDDPQVIFESLNARGAALLPSDLLRNFIFWRASHNSENDNILYQNYWAQIDNHFWKKEEKQGRLKRPRIDLFMQHFLQLKRTREINTGRMYQEYKNWISETQPYNSIEDELIDLTENAKVFKEFIEPNANKDFFNNFYHSLKILDVTTIYPLLLFIIGNKKFREEEKKDIIKDLESFLIRRLICEKTTKNYNNLFMQILRELKKEESAIALKKFLSKLDGDASEWPDDNKFERAWLTKASYDLMNSNKINYILKKIEQNSGNDKTEQITIHSTLTIEHILPVSWYKNWPLKDGNISKDIWDMSIEERLDPKIIEREIIKHSFGNLTLLTQPLNSSVSNGPFEQKRPEIVKNSSLRLNSYFQDKGKWDEDDIKERGSKLFALAKNIWPYPKELNN